MGLFPDGCFECSTTSTASVTKQCSFPLFFLDVKVMQINGRLETNLYVKPTDKHQYLIPHLRATASKYGESHDSSENSDFFLLRQKDPFGELFSEIHFQSSSEFTFLRNLGKFEIQLNQPRWPMEFIQNCTFSIRQYRKKGTCLDFIFTQFVIYSLVILLS